jgi:hypothetical protein
MEDFAPGAAAAARVIVCDTLSDIQRRRLERLTSEATRRAWLEPRRHRQKSRKQLSEEGLYQAHHELMWEAYRAVDFQPIGEPEIERSIGRLLDIRDAATNLARSISEAGSDVQLVGMWLAYRNNRRDDRLVQLLPDQLASVAKTFNCVADFFERAAVCQKPQGPVPPIGQPGSEDALKTTVIRQIAQTCQIHFGTVLYNTVATLAEAALGRTDIDRETVRGSLRNSS